MEGSKPSLRVPAACVTAADAYWPLAGGFSTSSLQLYRSVATKSVDEIDGGDPVTKFVRPVTVGKSGGGVGAAHVRFGTSVIALQAQLPGITPEQASVAFMTDGWGDPANVTTSRI